eukprot:3157743-Prymnesium_polylepis.2
MSIPYGMALHGPAENRLFVADGGNNRIVEIGGDDLAFRGALGSKGRAKGQFRCPSDVCVFGESLIVADFLNDRLQVFSLLRARADADTVLTTRGARVIGTHGRTPGRFRQPRSLAEQVGRLLVGECHRVQVLSLPHFAPLQVVPIPNCFAICGGLTAFAIADIEGREAPNTGKLYSFELRQFSGRLPVWPTEPGTRAGLGESLEEDELMERLTIQCD